jgi:hypothetical protein
MCVRFSYVRMVYHARLARFLRLAERRTDLMQVLQDLPVGPEHAGLVVSDGVISTKVSDDRLRFSQLVPG